MVLVFSLGLSRGVESQPVPAIAASAPAQREVVVGAYTAAYPYSFIDAPGGKVEGFAVDLLDALARVMNFRIRRVAELGADVQARFRGGNYEMLQMLIQTEGREEWCDYSVPILYMQNVPFVHRGERLPRRFEDLKGKLFAVAGRGSSADVFLRSRDPAIRIVYADSPSLALQLVESGAADATMMSRLTAVSLSEKLRLRNVIELRDASVYFEQRHCFAVRKGDTLLLARLNEGLALLQQSGEYERIYRKWLGRYEPAKFTRMEVLSYASAALAVALVLAVWAWLRQRALRARVAAQAEDLAAQGELVAALYENVPLAMWVFDLSPVGALLLSLNRRACELLGLTTAARGRRWEELSLAPEWLELGGAVLARARVSNVTAVEKHILPSSQRHVMVTQVPLGPRPDGVPRLCVLVEDVTERWRLDEEVAQGRRLRAIGELVGGIAHEFNNLMTPVMLTIGEVRAARPADRELQDDLEVATTAVTRAAELTARLLTFGRKGGRGAEMVSLAVAVQGACALLRPTFDRRITWEIAVPDLPLLLFNAADLNQILVNLLFNARDTLLDKLEHKDTPAWTPLIRIAAEQRPPEAQDKLDKPSFAAGELVGWQRLLVEDNGLGMTAAVRERVFEPFYTTKRTKKGTGLGLATVWHLVAEAGGRVDVDTTPGEGSAFLVWLPVWANTPSAAVAKPKAERKIGSAISILLVDDEMLVVDTMAAVLRSAGHKLNSISHGTAAWEHMQGNLETYDLLIVDLNMPGIDGIEFSQRVRAAGYAGRLLIVSGHLGTDSPTQFGGVAIDGVLRKPFNRAELLAAIERCLRK
jgi:signal transduction histidine kinase/ActR/RegA family two-component response regulator